MQDDAEAARGRRRRSGSENRAPLSRTVCFARVIRRVIVASETRKARAISAVVNPPTARRVSAIWAAGASDG